MTTTQKVGSGRFTYQMQEDWAKVPAGWNMPAGTLAQSSCIW